MTQNNDMILKLSLGNVGAAIVLAQCLKEPKGPAILEKIDRLGLRSHQIWLAYKDYANQDLQTFMKAIEDEAPGMYKVISDYEHHGKRR